MNHPVFSDNTPYFQTVSVEGISLNISNMKQALQEFEFLLKLQRSFYICFFEANLLYRSMRDESVKNVVNGAALTYPDGIAVKRMMECSLHHSIERVSGPSFMLQVCDYGRQRKWKHFFLGGAEGVAERLTGNLQKRYPGLEVVGCYCPPFRPLVPGEEKEMIQMIREAKPDILWVGLGGPKQEFWMNKYCKELAVPVMLGVGAAFDFHSGNRPWAPKVIRTLGLEWLYRAISGGRKTAVRNLFCVSRVGICLTSNYVKYLLQILPQEKTQKRWPDQSGSPCSTCDGLCCSLSMPYCPFQDKMKDLDDAKN